MARVYRVEKPDQWGNPQGPYSDFSNFGDSPYSQIHNHPYSEGKERHPSVQKDKGPIRKANKYDNVFAFSSPHQLHAWFNQGDLNRLADKGYGINAYDTDAKSIMHGQKQVAVKKGARLDKLPAPKIVIER